MIMDAYLEKKRIVVISGAGFLGKNVVAKLQEHGRKDFFVQGVSLYRGAALAIVLASERHNKSEPVNNQGLRCR